MIILDFFCLTSDCLGLVFYSLGVPGVSDGKESTCNEGNLGSIPGLGRYPGKGNSYLLQYSGLENSMDCIESDTTERLPLSTNIGRSL